jgi:sporulation protein YlmC with PRC-barrel domain
MLQRLLLTTAIAALALTPVLAQESGTGVQPQSPTMETPPPEPMAQDQTAPTDVGQPPAEMAEELPATPPPAEAIIAEESATDMRAEKLIGTSVYNTEGQEVGTVRDIVFDQEGKIVGVVLKVGGFLGMGGKSVGIAWDQVKMSPDQQVLEIGYSGDELQVAPDFKTQEAIQAEREAAMQQQQQQPAAPPQ